jgi:tripartite-type tricarboxylate transporter receptor subunit TctC
MLTARFVLSASCIAATVLGTGVASGQASSTGSGQAYPNKPIRIVTSPAGGGVDMMLRLIAPPLATGLGQQVIVDNRPVIIGTEAAAKAPPDGYTLLMSGPVVWLLPFMRDNVPWDPVRDFSPLTLVVSNPSILAAHPSLPAKSAKELIALAKARPGDLNYAIGATGGPPHFAGELFKSMAGVNIVLVPYKGTGAAITGVVSGEVQLMFASPGSVVQQIKSGRLRALAVTSAKPSALVPGVPTVADSGLPGYESETKVSMLAPAKTPAAIINRLNEELVRVLNRADIKEKLFNTGAAVVASSPEELAAAIRAEMAGLGKVIKDAGIRDQ